ncbi:hypothetical protein AAFF_G00258680 [Aldrovandia affinis]|uniref:Uncharacterized protein n=1 Tax=Aldrovandia affinis TaxID=143900 RepID=A0AAD7STE9_9TELE|nr:hypothetical protein AAFF_G00258680 [Aldrovandia affinis]
MHRRGTLRVESNRRPPRADAPAGRWNASIWVPFPHRDAGDPAGARHITAGLERAPGVLTLRSSEISRRSSPQSCCPARGQEAGLTLPSHPGPTGLHVCSLGGPSPFSIQHLLPILSGNGWNASGLKL